MATRNNHPHTYVDVTTPGYLPSPEARGRWVTSHVLALVELLDCHVYADVCPTTIVFLICSNTY